MSLRPPLGAKVPAMIAALTVAALFTAPGLLWAWGHHQFGRD